MYEACPEAHEKWLEAEAGRRMSRNREYVFQLVNGVLDEGAERARWYERSAHTAWQAHKLGKCSCELRRQLSKR